MPLQLQFATHAIVCDNIISGDEFMNKLLLKQVSILSIIAGIILALLTLIPVVGQLAFIVLMALVSAIIIVFMAKFDLIDIMEIRESVVLGALIGFVSFLAFAVVFLPAAWGLGRFFNLAYLYGISMILNVGSFGIIFLLTLFVAVLSATINAFSAFITFYVLEFLKSIEKNDNDKFKL